MKQHWSNNGPDGGPYSQDLRRSQAKRLEKVEKIGRSFIQVRTWTDHSSRSNSKRARENTPSDDDLSLHAQDDLDDRDEDLKLLTEQSSATGQARETPVPEAKILQDIANGFEDDDATGDKIMQQLADIATKRWGKKLSSGKLKNLHDKYKRPENCADIKATKVNPEIQNQLKVIPLKLFYYQIFFWNLAWLTFMIWTLKNGVTVLVYTSAGS